MGQKEGKSDRMRMWSEQCVPARPLLTWGRGFKEEREDTVAGKETVRWLNLALPGSPLSVERTVVGLVEGGGSQHQQRAGEARPTLNYRYWRKLTYTRPRHPREHAMPH
ncbi:hypothetical protein Pcinc_026398 [Petrolisthes cinctipes]|uniref:Uncharacterized protein n=1 Tax=Petrolisthes cinctipes TaxID=88211 RepID=A0AAE1KBN8_PETCI|nr:hypothetical protein Pcinc_026398 [Petrolisthes cinctipes]